MKDVWAVARWEATMVRRKVRYWVFGILAVLVALAQANIHSIQNYFLSRQFALSGSIAYLNPKFLFVAYMMMFSLATVLATTFLAFDFRVKEKIAQLDLVMGARPISTGSLVAGKFLGVFIPVYALGIFTVFAITVSNLIWGYGVIPRALVAFLTLQLPVTIAVLIALTALIGVLVRSRALTAIATLLLVIGIMALNFGAFEIPFRWIPALDFLGVYMFPFPSMMTGMWPMLGQALPQRLGFLCFAVGLLGITTLLYPRPSDGRGQGRVVGITVGALLAAAALIAVPLLQNSGLASAKKEILAEQEALVDAPSIGVTRYEIELSVDPGSSLSGVATMKVVNRSDREADRLVFTLNRGLDVDSVQGPDGKAWPFERGRSVVTVTPPSSLGPNAETELRMEYGGGLDFNAGYLEAGIDLNEIDPQQGQVALLGYMNAMFSRRAAVLLPEIRWYPSPNPDYGHGPSGWPANFAMGRLTIDTPAGMVPVTQGVPGEGQEAGGRLTTVFDVERPVPGFSLCVAPYQMIEGEVNGVSVAIYHTAAHAEAVSFFEDARDRISEELGNRFENAEETAGLRYPFRRLALVEVPIGLRAYGGGWEMPSTLTQPGVILIKEILFETNFARFFDYRKDSLKEEGEEIDEAEIKWKMLDELFRYDYAGGNFDDLLAAQFWRHRIESSGPVGAVLDRAFAGQAARLTMGRITYFNPYIYAGGFSDAIGAVVQQSFVGSRGQEPFDFTEMLRSTLVDQEEVWELLESKPLSELEPGEDPRDYFLAVDLKGQALVSSLRQRLGERPFAEVMGTLVERHGFGSYDLEDLRRVAADVTGQDLGEFFSIWVESTKLPGFRILESDAYRIETESGLPRYQTVVRVQNGEEVPGFLRLALFVESVEGETSDWDTVERFVSLGPTEEKEIGIVTGEKPRRVELDPYLSLNRSKVSEDLEPEEEGKETEPFEGEREVEFTGLAPGVVLCDDLDEGFSVEGGTDRGALRVAARTEDSDGTVPACAPSRQPSGWCRSSLDKGFGWYRHGVTLKSAGKGEGVAIWRAEMDGGGTCRVEVSLPVLERFAWRMRFRGEPEGKLNYVVQHADGEDEVPLEIKGLSDGWNGLGEFRFEPGQSYEVRLTDESEGLVVADAVRWTCKS